MRRIATLLLAFSLVLGASLVGEAFSGKRQIISTSSENIWDWKWTAQPTKGADYRLLASRQQADRWLGTVVEPARADLTKALERVNFDKQVAVLAYLAQVPTTGYRVEIGQIDLTRYGIQVWVGRQSPAKDQVVAPAVNYPYDVVTLSRKDVPTGAVRFQVLDQTGKTLIDRWLTIPGAPGPAWHKVWYGETLWSIAQRYGLTLSKLLALNPNVNPSVIWPGQALRIG